MSESLAERLRRLAEQQAKEKAAEQDVRNFQERVNSYISDNAKAEFDKLKGQLNALVEQVNPALGNLPLFQFHEGWPMVQQGNCVASIHFDKPIVNDPANQLLVSFGPHPNNIYFDGPPDAMRYRLHAAATDALDGIVWVGDLGELTTTQLAEFILEQLTNYYLDHMPGP